MTQIAVVQMASGPQVAANLLAAEQYIAAAAQEGAKLVLLPENCTLMPESDEDKMAHVEALGHGPMQDALAAAAQRYGVWVVAGSLPIASDDGRPTQTLVVWDENGARVTHYHKLHLFDVYIAATGEHYTESKTTRAGSQIVTVDSPVGRLGLSICFDLRFPELYRSLSEAGADVLLIPSAFTRATGRAHWELLLRARAVENLCFVAAAAQGGFHVGGRETYGHSCIIGPWGQTLALQQQGLGPISAEIDLQALAEARQQFPVLQQRVIHCAAPSGMESST